jgi:AraC-like DNA-binding protein
MYVLPLCWRAAILRADRAAREADLARKSDNRRQIQDAHRAWLQQLREATDLPLTRIAAEAGLAESTLTRLFSRSYTGTLHALTIEALKRRFRVPGPDQAAQGGLRETEATPYVADGAGPWGGAVQALLRAHAAADPWVLRTRALDLAGYLPGDIVVLDLNAAAQSGDVVCAQVYDFERMKAETIWRLYDPPYLVAASTDPSLRRPFSDASVSIKGVVVAQLRLRRTADAPPDQD